VAEAEPDTVWVISDVAPDGTYVVSLHIGDDIAVTLDRSAALTYAAQVVDAITRARFDAAVFRQQVAITRDQGLAVSIIVDLRADRPPLPDLGMPITFEPYVSGKTMEPGLYVHVKGERVGQWTADDADGHALHVLEVLAGVDLDAAYRRYLVGPIGLADDRARAVVGALAQHREPGETGRG
jgi:hypothetical protein